MKFVYTPEGAEPRSWDFDVSKLLNVEAEAIERKTGMMYGEWAKAVTKGSMTAMHGLLWVLLKRSQPQLKYEDVVFSLSELDFQVEDADAANIVKALRLKRDSVGLDTDEQLLWERMVEQGAPGTSDEEPSLDFEPGAEPDDPKG